MPYVTEPCPLIAGTILQCLDNSFINLGSALSPTIKSLPAYFTFKFASSLVVSLA